MPAAEFKAFPSCSEQALAIEYVKALDLSGKSPEELAQLYMDALIRIRSELSALARQYRNSTPASHVTVLST